MEARIKRIDNKHYEWVRTLPCCICGRRDITVKDNCEVQITTPHHVYGRQPVQNDYLIVPLCGKHHTEIHHGVLEFENKYNVIMEDLIIQTIIKKLIIDCEKQLTNTELFGISK